MTMERRAVLAGSAIAMTALSGPAAAKGATDLDIWLQANALLQACSDSLDRCDAEDFGAIFTPDGVFDYKPGMVIRGRPAIVAGATHVFSQLTRSSHNVGPPVVTRDGKKGWRSKSYFSAHHLLRDGTRFALHGRYEDLLELDPKDGALRIAYRKVIGHIGDAQSDKEDRYWLRPL